jgi:predicted transcriptional regulator YheO
MDFNQVVKIGQAIAKLFGTLTEVVVHDLKTQKIIFIEGSLSKRKVGDPSLLDDELNSLDEISLAPYTKLNFDGRLIKSISISISENQIPIALLCINFDISPFQDLNLIINNFLDKTVTKKPDILFKSDWQERINEFIHEYIKTNNLHFSSLTNNDKKKIVKKLYDSNAFSEKGSAEYIAKILDLSRASVFNYLRIYKGKQHAT